MRNVLKKVMGLPAITYVRLIKANGKPNSYRVAARFGDTSKIEPLGEFWPFCSIDVWSDGSMMIEYPVKAEELEEFCDKVIKSGLFDDAFRSKKRAQLSKVL